MKKPAHGSCLLAQRRIEGHRVVTLANDAMQVSVDLDMGAHIFEITDRQTGTDVLYKDPKGLAAHDVGGWYELFPNAGKSCEFQGVQIPAHGDVRQVPWSFTVREYTEREIIILFQTASRVLPFFIQRTVALSAETACIFVQEKITNRGTDPAPYLWGHHVTFGSPFVCAATRMDLPPCRIFKLPEYDSEHSRIASMAEGTMERMMGKDGEPLDIRYFPADVCAEMLFADGLESHWYNVFQEEIGLGFALGWDSRVFPYLWLWQENLATQREPFCGRVRSMALEPQSANVPVLSRAVQAGTAPVLAGGGSVETWLTAALHHDRRPVRHVARDGRVEYAEDGWNSKRGGGGSR